MPRLIYSITFVAVLLFTSVVHGACPDGVCTLADCEYATVNTAVNTTATYGDTVICPAGTETWESTLTITKGIILRGAGIGNTVITATGGTAISFSPDAIQRANDYRFEVTGFEFNGTIAFTEETSETVPSTKIVIANNKFTGTGNAITIDGHFWGVAYNNEFLERALFGATANQQASWDTFLYGTFGSAAQFYYEDNTVTTTADAERFYFNTGHGGRYAWRYNSVNAVRMANPEFDQHGNQEGGIYALMLCEVYGNIHEGYAAGLNRWQYQRGGRLLVLNNRVTGSGGTPNMTVNDDVDDSVSAVNDSNVSVQHPNNTYFLNNWFNGSLLAASEGTDCCTSIAENSEFWNYNADTLNGSTEKGINCGASIPTTGNPSCSEGDGFWVTSYSPCSTPPTTLADMRTYTQAGRLYKCNAAGAWELYFTPYTYPHPLRDNGNPPSISSPIPSGSVSCTSNPRAITLEITTNENATCKHDTTDHAYDVTSGVTFTTTGGTGHSGVTTLACGSSYIFYSTCVDVSGNTNTAGTQIYFTINAEESGGQSSTIGGTGVVKSVAPSTTGSGVFKIQ